VNTSNSPIKLIYQNSVVLMIMIMIMIITYKEQSLLYSYRVRS